VAAEGLRPRHPVERPGARCAGRTLYGRGVTA